MPQIPGPRGPIFFIRDEFGYPRIRARDHLDASFARGYLHAMDRLVQIHITIATARGQLMQLLGDVPIARMLDRAIRSLNLQAELDSQVEAMQPETQRILKAYCHGFNAYAKTSRWRPALLRLMGLSVEHFTPQTILLIYRIVSYFGLTSIQHLAEAVISELIAAKTPHEALEILLGDAADGLDLADLEDILHPDDDRLLAPPHLAGSNAFVVDGQRSASGGALLMSEFHMEIGRFPPVLYALHVDLMDGSYYQGMGIPGLAWLSAARTEHMGWAYTFGHADNFDIIFEECKDGHTLVGDQWQTLTSRTETAHIRGKPPEQWTFYDNDYGTIVGDASQDGLHPCIRWSGVHGGASCIDAAIDMMSCKDIETFIDLHRNIRLISLEAVLADDKGNIASIHSGQIDTRPPDWTGAFPRLGRDIIQRPPPPVCESTRPFLQNPPEGFIVSANAHAQGPNAEPWTTLPEPHYRDLRLREILTTLPQATLPDLVRASYDEVDLCAQHILAAWQPYMPQDADAQALCTWAANQTPEDDPQHRQKIGLFHALHHEVIRRLLRPYLGNLRIDRFLKDFSLTVYFQHHIDEVLLLQKPHLLNPKGLQTILQHAWPAAKQLAASEAWNVPVQAPFNNVLTQGALPSLLKISLPPQELPGGPVSAFQSRRMTLNEQPLYFGPAFHYTFDMSTQGGWYNIAGGASEIPWGPGYAKGIDAWKHGTFIPLGDATGQPPDLRPKGSQP